MILEIIHSDVSAGETVTGSWFPLLEDVAAHSIFSVITGDGTLTMQVYTAPSQDTTCDVLDDTVYSNSTAGKRRDMLSLEAAPWFRVVCTNNHDTESVHVRAWIVQTGK